MKKQNLVFLILLSALALVACDKILSATSNLVGTWDIYSVTQKAYTSGNLDTTIVQTDQGTFTFKSAGDGSYSVKNGDQTQSGNFDWFEKNNKVFINMLNLTDSILTENMAVGFDVITNTSTKQVWSATYSNYVDGTSPSGAAIKLLKKTYMEMELRKQ